MNTQIDTKDCRIVEYVSRWFPIEWQPLLWIAIVDRGRGQRLPNAGGTSEVKGMQRISGTVFVFVLALASAVWSPQAYAQTAEEGGEKGQISEAVDEAYPKRELLLFEEIPIVISATKLEQPITESPSSISVITAEDIKAIGATTLNEVLETVPGLHVSMSQIITPQPVYTFRGIRAEFNTPVLLLRNGVPITTAAFGGRVFGFRQPVESISRIEVIRGPGSAVYGADAMAGVINIITKDADEIDGTQVGARTGSFDTQNAWLQHGGTLAGWDVAFSLEYRQTDGDRGRIIDSDLQTTLDGTFGTNASLAPGPLDDEFNLLDTYLTLKREHWAINLWASVVNDPGVASGVPLVPDPRSRQDAEQYLVDIGYQRDDLIADWGLGTRLTYFHSNLDTRFSLFPSGAVLPIGPDGNTNFSEPAGVVSFPDGLIGTPGGNENIPGLEITGIYTGLKGHRVRVAGEVKYQLSQMNESKNFGPGVIDGTEGVVGGTLTNVTDTPFVFLPDQERSIISFSVQDEWAFAPDWDLIAGVRYDRFSDFGNTINPRVALVWQTRPDLTTRLLYGSAFRAPSFAEQFNVNNPVSLGNSNLDPETIDMLELGVDYRPIPTIRTALNVFGYRLDGQIAFVPDPGVSTRTAQNAKDQDGYGFEWEGEWAIRDTLSLRGNMAFQRSENRATNERVADVPGHQLYAATDWGFFPDWSLTPQVNWVADRVRARGDPREEIDDYATVDITLRGRRLFQHWELAASVRNLFDADAREPSTIGIPNDLPLSGRSVFVELRYNF